MTFCKTPVTPLYDKERFQFNAVRDAQPGIEKKLNKKISYVKPPMLQ